MVNLRIALGFVAAVGLGGCGTSGHSNAASSVDSGVPDTHVAPFDSGNDTGRVGNDAGSVIEAGPAPESGASEGGPPEVPIGAPIQAPDGQWTEVVFPDGYCRDGEQAHLMVHLNSKSKKMAIYLEGGGACFNDA